MLSHMLAGKMRPSLNISAKAASMDLATRKMDYEHVKIHATKYKSFAKTARRAAKRARAGMGMLTPKDIGEEQPLFFLPQRTKLFLRIMQDIRNNTRISRKPMPDAVREEYVAKSKEYNMYKQAEMRLME